MFGFIKLINKDKVEILKRRLLNEEVSRILGFGKMEKCRITGRIEAIVTCLEDFSVPEQEINSVISEGRKIAEANLINFTNR